jgi:hypothetical protein
VLAANKVDVAVASGSIGQPDMGVGPPLDLCHATQDNVRKDFVLPGVVGRLLERFAVDTALFLRQCCQLLARSFFASLVQCKWKGAVRTGALVFVAKTWTVLVNIFIVAPPRSLFFTI